MLFRFDDFEVDQEKFELRRNGEPQHIEPQTFDFLYFLIRNADRVVTREEIIEEVWQGRIVSDTTISSCVKSARKILGDDGEHQKYIKTTRGRGFQFVGNVDTENKREGKNFSDTIRKPTSHLTKQIAIYLSIAALVFVIGLMLFNRYQSSPTTFTSSNSDAPKRVTDEYTIAVMPFVDLSAGGNQEYFGDGISEEVLNVLTSVDQLNVISRTTAFSFKGQNLSVPEIAKRLNVNYIVEGSVRSAGNRIRISAQLVDTRSDSQLWSQNYDRELDDIFAIQDDISQQIAAALKVELIGGSIGRAAPTDNMEAYALYLQGHQIFLNRGTLGVANNIANIERAIGLLQQAVALDDQFAEAWADLATSYIVMPSYYDRNYSSARVVPLATDAADRAIRINPQLSQAWAVKSLVYLSHLDFERSEQAIIRATDLNPNNATAWLWQGLHFAAVGNQGKAIEAISRAIELAPSVPINHSALGMLLHARGQLNEALPSMDRAINDLGFEAGRIDRALVAIWRDNRDQALDHMVRFLKNYDQISDQELKAKVNTYIDAYYDSNLRADAAKLLMADMKKGIDTTFGLYMLQDAKIFIDDFENTFANKGFILSRIYNPIARPLFKQEMFRDYLIRIGLLDYWQKNSFPYFCRPSGENDFECYMD